MLAMSRRERSTLNGGPEGGVCGGWPWLAVACGCWLGVGAAEVDGGLPEPGRGEGEECCRVEVGGALLGAASPLPLVLAALPGFVPSLALAFVPVVGLPFGWVSPLVPVSPFGGLLPLGFAWPFGLALGSPCALVLPLEFVSMLLLPWRSPSTRVFVPVSP